MPLTDDQRSDAASACLDKIGNNGIVIIQQGTCGISVASDIDGTPLDHLTAWATVLAFVKVQAAEEIEGFAVKHNMNRDMLWAAFFEIAKSITRVQGEPEGTTTTFDTPMTDADHDHETDTRGDTNDERRSPQ